MNILITAIGKRVQLIEHLKQTFSVVGVDCSDLAPASKFVDSFHIVPPSSASNYIDELLRICHNEQVSLLIPLFECEFSLLSENRHRFAEIGTRLLLSDQKVLDICYDKWDTHMFFLEKNILTPASCLTLDDLNDDFPLFLKPRRGMGSHGVHRVDTTEELEFYIKRVESPIIQKFIEGTEYTIDCLCDLEGKALSIVPRERMEVISGEVSKTRTLHDTDVIKATKELCDKLGGVGPLTIQCIKTREGEIVFLEINPRFGGGVPATFAAGVNYGAVIRQIAARDKTGNKLLPFQDIMMLRYSEAVFV